uniref:Uncharacterized protein n=1 Tax=Chaetoceros debilis TaxID=122233 RepID=A0A7S3V9N5_9STRA|mmetsp:Transcript_6671/g.9809  ORF Transcript_6671/g.9809 Transcript_6671/m.9809 type:complete len:1614 (+) Transcript_6671:140-4981(+)
MGNCQNKGRDAVVVVRPPGGKDDQTQNGAFRYDKESKQIIYVGEHDEEDRTEITIEPSNSSESSTVATLTVTGNDISVTGSSPSTTNPTSNFRAGARTSAAAEDGPRSLLGEITEFLEDDASTIVTQTTCDQNGSPPQFFSPPAHQNEHSSIFDVSSRRKSTISPLGFENEHDDSPMANPEHDRAPATESSSSKAVPSEINQGYRIENKMSDDETEDSDLNGIFHVLSEESDDALRTSPDLDEMNLFRMGPSDPRDEDWDDEFVSASSESMEDSCEPTPKSWYDTNDLPHASSTDDEDDRCVLNDSEMVLYDDELESLDGIVSNLQMVKTSEARQDDEGEDEKGDLIPEIKTNAYREKTGDEVLSSSGSYDEVSDRDPLIRSLKDASSEKEVEDSRTKNSINAKEALANEEKESNDKISETNTEECAEAYKPVLKFIKSKYDIDEFETADIPMENERDEIYNSIQKSLSLEADGMRADTDDSLIPIDVSSRNITADDGNILIEVSSLCNTLPSAYDPEIATYSSQRDMSTMEENKATDKVAVVTNDLTSPRDENNQQESEIEELEGGGIFNVGDDVKQEISDNDDQLLLATKHSEDDIDEIYDTFAFSTSYSSESGGEAQENVEEMPANGSGIRNLSISSTKETKTLTPEDASELEIAQDQLSFEEGMSFSVHSVESHDIMEETTETNPSDAVVDINDMDDISVTEHASEISSVGTEEECGPAIVPKTTNDASLEKIDTIHGPLETVQDYTPIEGNINEKSILSEGDLSYDAERSQADTSVTASVRSFKRGDVIILSSGTPDDDISFDDSLAVNTNDGETNGVETNSGETICGETNVSFDNDNFKGIDSISADAEVIEKRKYREQVGLILESVEEQIKLNEFLLTKENLLQSETLNQNEGSVDSQTSEESMNEEIMEHHMNGVELVSTDENMEYHVEELASLLTKQLAKSSDSDEISQVSSTTTFPEFRREAASKSLFDNEIPTITKESHLVSKTTEDISSEDRTSQEQGIQSVGRKREMKDILTDNSSEDLDLESPLVSPVAVMPTSQKEHVDSTRSIPSPKTAVEGVVQMAANVKTEIVKSSDEKNLLASSIAALPQFLPRLPAKEPLKPDLTKSIDLEMSCFLTHNLSQKPYSESPLVSPSIASMKKLSKNQPTFRKPVVSHRQETDLDINQETVTVEMNSLLTEALAQSLDSESPLVSPVTSADIETQVKQRGSAVQSELQQGVAQSLMDSNQPEGKDRTQVAISNKVLKRKEMQLDQVQEIDTPEIPKEHVNFIRDRFSPGPKSKASSIPKVAQNSPVKSRLTYSGGRKTSIQVPSPKKPATERNEKSRTPTRSAVTSTRTAKSKTPTRTSVTVVKKTPTKTPPPKSKTPTRGSITVVRKTPSKTPARSKVVVGAKTPPRSNIKGGRKTIPMSNVRVTVKKDISPLYQDRRTPNSHLHSSARKVKESPLEGGKTPSSIPWDESSNKGPNSIKSKTSRATQLSPSPSTKLRSSVRSNASQTRRKTKPLCTEKWDPYLFDVKAGCERCLELSSEAEREFFFENGRHQRITRTSGGCTVGCNRYCGARFYEDEAPRLCRICFNATHRKPRKVNNEKAERAGPRRKLVAEYV